MKKTSSKIIISLILALFLWTGVNFDFGKTTNYINLGVGKAEAYTDCRQELNNYKNPEDGATATEIEAARQVWITCDNKAQAEAKATLAADDARKKEINQTKPKGFFADLADLAEGAITGPIGKIVMMVQGILLQGIAIPLASIIFRISAAFLDMAVNFTLSTKIFEDTASGVTIIWILIRNICNITFIFILLWSAIQMIIGLAGANTKKMVANVIIAALLINFSLFITGIVIDAGNILAVALFNQIQAGSSMVGTVDVPFAGQGLGAILMQALGMSGITGAATGAVAVNGIYSISFGIISYLQLITIIVALIVFMYAMLLLAARIVALIFLAALSPIGFMGSVLPKFEEYSKMWRETLYGQVMIAPVFLLFVYLIIQVSKAFDKVPNGTIASTGLNDTTDQTQYLAYFKYVMVILLLVIAVKVTKKMTGEVGKMVEGIGKMAAGLGLAAVTGGAAFAMRATIGRGANAAATSQTMKDWSVSDSIAKRWSSKATMAISGGVAKKSFDVRGISAVSNAAKEHLGVDVKEGAFGTKFGSLGKGGYAGRLTEQEKAAEERTKMLSAGISFSDDEIKKKRDEKEAQFASDVGVRELLRKNDNRTDEETAKLKKMDADAKAYAALDDEGKKDKIEADMILAKKIERLKAAAKQEQGIDWENKLGNTKLTSKIGRAFNSTMGGNRAKAKKFREGWKKKDSKTQIFEAVQKAADDTAEPDKTKTASSAAPTSGGSTGGGTSGGGSTGTAGTP